MVIEEIEAKLITSDKTVRVQVRFACLQGYLLAKADAVKNRGQQKDYYDFVYVPIHNKAGGPLAAGKMLRAGKFAKDIANARRLWLEISAPYERPTDIGPISFAVQSMQAEPENDEARLRQDAVAAIREFTGSLR